MQTGTLDTAVVEAVERETSLKVTRKTYLNEYQTQTKNTPTYFSSLCTAVRQLSRSEITESDVESLAMYIKIIVSQDLIDQSDYSVVLRILAGDFQYDQESFVTDVLRNRRLPEFV